MDLNTATITELQTLKGIGEVRAAAIIKKRLELNNPLSMEDLVTAEVVPYDVLKNLLDTEAIRDVPYQCGETITATPKKADTAQGNVNLEALLIGMQKSINDLVMAAQHVDLRMDQMDERFTANESSLLALMNHPVTGEVEEKTKPTLSERTSSISPLTNKESTCLRASTLIAGSQQQPPAQKDSCGSIFKTKMPVFDGRSRWQAYLLQFQTILFMHQCDDERIMVCKLVEALRDKALDYFESLPVVVRLDFAALCKAMENRFGRTEHGPIIRAKLQASSQLVNESLDEFADRVQRMATDGLSGMDERWVQLMAVDVLLKGCLDKRAALQAMDKEPSTISDAVRLLKRTSSYEQVLGLGPKQVRQVAHVEEHLSEGDSPEIRKVTTHVMPAAGDTTTGVLQVLEKMSDQLSTLVERSTASRVTRRTPPRCYACNELGHFARNCPQPLNSKARMNNAKSSQKVEKNE